MEVVGASRRTPGSARDRSVPKGQRTRAALVEAAVARFAVDGFRRTSVADVARDVGVSAAAVYRYFPDKEALFTAAVDADVAQLLEVVRTTFFEQFDLTFTDAAPLVWRRLITELTARPLVRRVLQGGEPIDPEQILGLPRLEELRVQARAVFALGQQTGLARTDVDADQLLLGVETIVFHQLAHVAGLQSADAPDEDERWTAVAAVIDAALRSSRTRPRPT